LFLHDWIAIKVNNCRNDRQYVSPNFASIRAICAIDRCVALSSGVPERQHAQMRAGIHASKNAAVENDGFCENVRNIRAGRNTSRKKIIGITHAPFAAVAEAASRWRCLRRQLCSLRFSFPFAVARYVHCALYCPHRFASSRHASLQ
jgi:hypothetical protein